MSVRDRAQCREEGRAGEDTFGVVRVQPHLLPLVGRERPRLLPDAWVDRNAAEVVEKPCPPDRRWRLLHRSRSAEQPLPASSPTPIEWPERYGETRSAKLPIAPRARSTLSPSRASCGDGSARQDVVPRGAALVDREELRSVLRADTGRRRRTCARRRPRNDKALLQLLRSPNIRSRAWIYHRYDHLVGSRTVRRPGLDAAVLRLRPSLRGLAVSLDGDRPDGPARPAHRRRRSPCSRRRATSPAPAASRSRSPTASTSATRRSPRSRWELAEAIEGMAQACEALGIPVVSGNVSLYNETDGRPIYPTPVVGCVGLVEDVGASRGAGARATRSSSPARRRSRSTAPSTRRSTARSAAGPRRSTSPPRRR